MEQSVCFEGVLRYRRQEKYAQYLSHLGVIIVDNLNVLTTILAPNESLLLFAVGFSTWLCATSM